MKTKLGINGVCGRMGKRIVQLAKDDPELHIAAAIDFAGHAEHGLDVGVCCGVGAMGVNVTADLPLSARLDVMIDFSTPEGTMSILKTCIDRKIPLVVATTGHTDAQQGHRSRCPSHGGPDRAGMSLVVNVLFKLVEQAARAQGQGFRHRRSSERHHRYKKDSPSGTALHFAKIIQDAMGDMPIRHGREGLVGERPAQEIGMHAVRSGDNGRTRSSFQPWAKRWNSAQGPHARRLRPRRLQAAKFLADKPAGRYSMADVLGL